MKICSIEVTHNTSLAGKIQIFDIYNLCPNMLRLLRDTQKEQNPDQIFGSIISRNQSLLM